MVCACGCGGETATGTFKKGHHGRGVGGFADLPPDEKTCEQCGQVYRRCEQRHRQSNKHWRIRRFCGEACRRAARSAASAEQCGELHPSWLGDEITAQAGRKRARILYPDPEPCEVCGDEVTERHHRDGDTVNNEPENIAWLCRKHHIQVEDRMAYRRTA